LTIEEACIVDTGFFVYILLFAAKKEKCLSTLPGRKVAKGRSGNEISAKNFHDARK
jgi:hypothetical protein